MKFLNIILLCILAAPFSAIRYAECQDCPYTNINCAQCCKAGRFASSECLARCNCWQYNDEAGAEYKDFPV